MKFILSVFVIFLMVLQISCGPQTATYRGLYVVPSSDRPAGDDSGFNDDLFNEDIKSLRDRIVSGADVNSRFNGMYPIEYAVRFNKVKSLKFLLENNANPNIKDASGQTPLFGAGSKEVVQLLLEHGVDPDLKDINNKTAADVVEPRLKKVILAGKGNFRYIINGDLAGYKKSLNKFPISIRDSVGNTSLHVAAIHNQIKITHFLLSKGFLVTSKNNKGQTALDVSKESKNDVSKLLSCKLNNHCKTVASFERYISTNCTVKTPVARCRKAVAKDIHGVFTSETVLSKMANAEYIAACKKFSYAACYKFTQKHNNSDLVGRAQRALENFKPRGMAQFSKVCGASGKTKICKQFINNHPGLIEESKAKHAFVYLNQKCRVNEDGWIYQGRQCKGSWVHGEGKSVNSEKNLSFIGLYRNGKRVKGLLSYNNQPMFDGVVSNGRPNGEGICFYKGDPEKCEFYKGKRVDAIFKQRIANAEQERKMDAKLAEMKKLQQQQNNKISQMQGQINSSQQNTSSGGGGIGQQIGDYALKKAGEKVMDSLFDRLF